MASIMGSAMAFLCQFLFDSWRETFIVSSVVMGATYLLFFLGIFCYYPEEKPSGSPVTIIYRLFKEAIKKRRLSYPSSKHGYNNEGSDDTLDDLFYPTADNGDEVHLLPRHPSFLSFLDKAAIKNNSDDGGSEERNEKEDCTAEQVRDVKSLYPMIPLEVFTFLAYSFVSAPSNTYFVLQTTNLYSYVGKFDVPIMVFPALQYLVASGVTKIIESPGTKEKVKPIWNMAFGMLFSGVCYIVAWQVERQRLSLVKSLRHPDKDMISLSIMVLIPQFLLLGLMNGFVECGLQTFSRDRVHSESMKKFVDPFIGMVLGIAKLASILFTSIIFRSWIKGKINDSRLDKYYLVLALLSFVYLGIYVSHAKFKLQIKPQSVEPERLHELDLEAVLDQVDINSSAM